MKRSNGRDRGAVPTGGGDLGFIESGSLMVEKGLNPKQARFVEEFLVDSNATQAAIRAGYSAKTAKQIGSRLLTNVDIARLVEARTAKMAQKMEITAERIVEEMSVPAFATIAEPVPWASKVKALENLGKRFNLFPDKVDINAKVEAEPVDMRELGRRIAYALRQAEKEVEQPVKVIEHPPQK